jgi:uncharacterized protein
VADPLSKMLIGLFAGFLFGFILQKAHVTKFPVIVGQFLLRDFTVMKTMLTAIVVGGVGVYALKAMGLASLHVKPAQLAAVAGGGLVFGVGMVLLGYCPGTGVAAAAEGRRDALFGVLGMLGGAAIFAEIYGGLTRTLLTWFDLGPVTLPELMNVPAWLVFGVLIAATGLLFRVLRSEPRG